jgi:membrane protein DedA with SNARE-associated domain
VIIVARYVPGGRTAVTLTAGVVRYRRSSFTLFDGIAGYGVASVTSSPSARREAKERDHRRRQSPGR